MCESPPCLVFFALFECVRGPYLVKIMVKVTITSHSSCDRDAPPWCVALEKSLTGLAGQVMNKQ